MRRESAASVLLAVGLQLATQHATASVVDSGTAQTHGSGNGTTTTRGRPGGVCVLGTPAWLPTDAEPYERYVQVQLEWSEVEASRGRYNFSLLAAQLRRLDTAGKSNPARRAIVKLQTNSKPRWVYDVVPSTAQVWSAENWDNRTAMYWHPTYVSLYLALVEAFARYCAVDRLAVKYIDFTRQSWCAIGEEGIGIPGKPAAVATLRKGSAWDVPAGCTQDCHPPPDWSASTDTAYQRSVLQRYNLSYGGQSTQKPRLLVRTNTPSDLIAPYRAQFRTGNFGWFHTGAGMFETQCFNQSQRYVDFQRDCLPLGSTTVCFAEMYVLQYLLLSHGVRPCLLLWLTNAYACSGVASTTSYRKPSSVMASSIATWRSHTG